MFRTLLIAGVVAAALPARAEPVRLLVAVGDDVGDPDEPSLRYAVSDARKVAAVFVELGHVAPERALVLENAPREVPLIGFYSGVEVAPFEGAGRPLDWTGVLTVLAR